MPLSFRFLLPTVLALALAATPAYAGNSSAPGVLKKQEAATEAPAAPPVATPAPSADVPAVVKQHGNAQAKTPGATNAPVAKGRAKTLAANEAQPPAPAAQTLARKRTTRAAHDAAARGGSSAAQARRRSHAKSSGLAASREPAYTRSGTPTPSAVLADGQAQARRAAGAARRPSPPVGHTTGSGGTDAAEPAGTLTSVTRVADRVVEVIPGAIVLALAGLAALVLVLVARSWLMDRRRVNALERSYGVTVEALATAIEAKDHTTGGHIERVRRLGLLLAGELVPREARDPQMAYGFLLHDIGKLAVPDAILRAPGRLSDDEWALMRRHPEEGARMLAEIPFLDRALDVVLHHHERWDGGGYPDGLAGEEIPLWARIFSVVDALDAITAERPYRAGRPYEDALAEIQGHAGTQFDPAVVEGLVRIDKARIEPLIEPAQQLGALHEPAAGAVSELGPLVAA